MIIFAIKFLQLSLDFITKHFSRQLKCYFYSRKVNFLGDFSLARVVRSKFYFGMMTFRCELSNFENETSLKAQYSPLTLDCKALEAHRRRDVNHR